MKTNRKWKDTNFQNYFRKLVKESKNIADLTRKMNYSTKTKNYPYLELQLIKQKIDYSHFMSTSYSLNELKRAINLSRKWSTVFKRLKLKGTKSDTKKGIIKHCNKHNINYSHIK